KAQYARTTAAIAARRRLGSKPKPFRTYALRGLLWCTYGTRLRGEAHLQRGTEIRYYRCPTLGCKARRCPAEAIESEVLALIGAAVLPKAIVDVAQAELRKRLQTPVLADVGRQRGRLTKRLEQIKKHNGWGDMPDDEYLAERDSIRVALAALPDNDRIRSFDAHRARVLELPEAIAVASPARREQLCRIVIERVVIRDRRLDSVVWTPPVRPFFEKQRVCPQGDSNP
ncbi:MAG TPA: zinc ribbon domain-containing protein, partial [Candidatus Limnocylindrales bacterium]